MAIRVGASRRCMNEYNNRFWNKVFFSFQYSSSVMSIRNVLWLLVSIFFGYINTVNYDYKDYNMIMSAIKEFHDLTCVKWVRWSGEEDYVYFVPGNTGCWSSVGRLGGMQELNLQTPGCLTKKGTVVHEMLHALGFLHEQNRYERDAHVTINWKNVQPGKEQNFEKAKKGTADGQGVPYDYGSVMHYSANSFSSNGKPTIIPKVKGIELGQREGLSPGDIQKIRKMYKCGADGGRKRRFPNY